MNGNCNYHGMAQQNAGIIDTVRRHVAELVNPEVVYLLGLGESSRRTESLFTATSARMSTVSHCYLLVLVEKKDDEFTLNCLQDKIETHLGKFIGATVIVLTLHSFNTWLQEGHPFAGVVKEKAVCLHLREGVVLQEAKAPDLEKLKTENEKLVKETEVRVKEFLAGAELFLMRKQNEMSAFMLHQAAEQALRTFMIVHTGYRFNCHSIDRLVRCCSMFCYKLPDVFPKADARSKKVFGLLKDAYIGGRYKKDYAVGDEDVVVMMERVRRMVGVVFSF